MRTRTLEIALASGVLCALGCASGTDSNTAPTVSDLEISIASPVDGATGVAVSAPDLRATFSRELQYPELLEVVVYEDTKSLFVEGKRFYGSRRYSAISMGCSVPSPFEASPSTSALPSPESAMARCTA